MSKRAEPATASKVTVGAVVIESVADILERELDPLIEAWLLRVEKESDLTRIRLTHDERTGH